MDRAEPLRVTVVYCAPGIDDVVQLALPAGSTVADAIERSGVVARHSELSTRQLDPGIWGRRCAGNERLHDGDRVEIYRPLIVDPKEARRVRAEVRRRRSGERS